MTMTAKRTRKAIAALSSHPDIIVLVICGFPLSLILWAKSGEAKPRNTRKIRFAGNDILVQPIVDEGGGVGGADPVAPWRSFSLLIRYSKENGFQATKQQVSEILRLIGGGFIEGIGDLSVQVP